MARRLFEKNGLKWLRVNEPTSEDFEYIKTVFRFHPLVIETITAPTLHPEIAAYRDHLFLILHFPIIFRDQVANAVAEVDFLITKKIIVTLTYRSHPRLEEFFEKISKDSRLQRRFVKEHSGELLYGIIDYLLGSLIHDLDFLEEQVTGIEEEIFENRRPTLVEEISKARRNILDFRRITSPMQTVLNLLPQIGSKFYGKEMEPYFTDLLASESKIRHLIENHKETIEALQETNESLLSNQISQIIKLLTIFSAILLPLNLIASVWGMNQKSLPLSGGAHDFWIIISAMIAVALLLIAFFHGKKWL